jgi:hypothetical protein
MTRIDLAVRAICEYAQRRELSLSPTGLVLHRGDVVCDDDAMQVIALLDEGVLREDGDLIVPALVTDLDLDEALARYGVEVP